MNISTASSETSLVCIEMPTSAWQVVISALNNLQKNLWTLLLEDEFIQNYCRECGYYNNQRRIVADFVHQIQSFLKGNEADYPKLTLLKVEWEFIWELIYILIAELDASEGENCIEIADFLEQILEEIDLNLFGTPNNTILH